MATNTYTKFNPDLMLVTKKDIVFDQDMQFLFLDMPKSDIPTMSLFGAKQYIQDIYDLILFTHRIFSNQNFASHLYLIQKEQPVPGGDLMRYSNSDGYMLLAAFSKEEFETHFHTIGRAAIALNCGFKTIHAINNTQTSLDDLANIISQLNGKDGTFVGTGGKEPKDTIGHFRVTSDLDKSIEEYNNNMVFNEDGSRRKRVCIEKDKGDTQDMWLERARLLSWEYQLKQSERALQSRESIFALGKLLSKNETTHKSGAKSIEDLNKLLYEIQEDHPLTDMFRMHVAWLNWDCNVKKDGTDTVLDIKKRIAWDITQYRYDFYNSRFFMIHIDEDAINQVAANRNVDVSDMNVEQWLSLQHHVLNLCSDRIQHGIDRRMREEAESLYPVLDRLRKETYQPIAKSLGKEGKVCRLYQDPPFRSFFAEKYRNEMSPGNSSNMSKARREQYEVIATLTGKKNFTKCFMNSLIDNDQHKRLLVFTSDRQNVDPLQDAMANHFLRMAKISGVRQMSLELFIMLLGNIWSFTTIENKPIVVLDGAPGSGKSNCASIAKLIMCWRTFHAAQSDNYVTSRSQTVPGESDRYSSVLGTRIVNEWASENMTNDTSVDATIMKNLFDSGLCTSQRACKNKSERGTESFRKIYDVSLDNRTVVILANGFEACWSIRDRSLIYNVPALKVNISSCSLEEKNQELDNAAIPSQFALIRYLISEQLNRDSLNLSLKSCDSEKMSPTYETNLTLERISFVLTEMGFKENMMTQRKKDNIARFALVFAHYRAVFEVFGCVTKFVQPRKPTPVETLCDYNDYLVKVMQTYLNRKNQVQRDILLAQRVVVDPTDIITTSTLLLQLERVEEKLLKVIALHMTSFEQTEQDHGETYFVIENVTLERLHDKMKSQGHGIMLDSLKKRLQKLDDNARIQNVPNMKLLYENSGVNKNREKNERLFTIHVHTEFAAKLFLTEEIEQVEECIGTVTNHIKNIISGREEHKTYKYANHFDPKEGITSWFKGHMAMTVPAHLRRAFGFLSHIPGKNKYIFYGFPEAGVHPDFAKCRTRAFQSIVLEEFKKHKQNGELPPSFSVEDKYLQVDALDARSFNDRLPGLPEKLNERLLPLVKQEDETLQVHVDIFTSNFDKIEGINQMREHIVKRFVLTGELANENYFSVTDDKMCHTIKSNQEMMTGQVKNTNAAALMKETQRIFFNPSLLNKIPSFVKRKKSITQTFVESCLCENMTSLQSVLYFDRELIYETQNEDDAIGFVNVSEVAQSLPEGKLPEWSSSGVNESKDSSNEDVYSEVLSSLTIKKTKNKKLTFQPDHMNTHLALKRLYATNKINELITMTDEIAATRREKKCIFIEKLNQLLSSTIETHLKNLYHPIVKKEDELATDVYNGSHPIIQMCINPQKRLADDCDQVQAKRPCISH